MGRKLEDGKEGKTRQTESIDKHKEEVKVDNYSLCLALFIHDNVSQKALLTHMHTHLHTHAHTQIAR